MEGDLELRRFVKKMEEAAKGTFWEELGCVLVRAEPGITVVTLDAGSRHLNGIGILHGGVHASLLDNTMGITAMVARPNDKIVTTNLNVHYLSPLGPGPVTVTAELIHESRKMVTVFGKIEDESGRLGSWGSGSFRVLAAD
ncbi:PaaI family thioesterase [Paenibacillus ginsengarvi]|uniref:PaaI family thioesterase n=1 Tax=Paenibacillus ginsengarvi TaxID=400777 RepID=A0A3B0CG44_9BACL|nr:PaaI family thioesterase [Paenibacillus ginsengarvi]RKN84180.1 PaaI family thioesterase [Paenibacillus ginsengarvi]